jgi:DNA-binding MarR family transcriptional regulator
MYSEDNTSGRKVNGHNGAHAPIGHNGGEPISVDEALASFDAVAKDVLSSGLIITQRDALMRCILDPDLSRQDQVVLVGIIEHANKHTGLAYPGRRLLATRLGYTEAGISKALARLRARGYIISAQRAVNGAGRALVHYLVTKTPQELMEEAIAEHVQFVRRNSEAGFTPGGKATGFTPVGKASSGFTPVGKPRLVHEESGFTPVAPAGFTPVAPTVTSIRTRREVKEVSGGAVAPSGASAPSPTIDEQVISSAEELARHPEAVTVAEIIDAEVEVLEPVEAGQGFGSAKPKAKRANGSGAKTDRSSHKDRGTLWNPDNFDLEKIQAYAASQGLTPDETRIVWKRLKNWTEAKQYRYIDWNAAFRKQVDDDINDGRVGPNKRKHGRGNGRMSIDEIAEAATQTAAAAPKFKMT